MYSLACMAQAVRHRLEVPIPVPSGPRTMFVKACLLKILRSKFFSDDGISSYLGSHGQRSNVTSMPGETRHCRELLSCMSTPKTPWLPTGPFGWEILLGKQCWQDVCHLGRHFGPTPSSRMHQHAIVRFLNSGVTSCNPTCIDLCLLLMWNM